MIDSLENMDVKSRLLDAGEELFAEYGYDGTTMRMLTQKAGCNLAAVNYYFGGKHGLYLEVISRKMRYMRDKRLEKINRLVGEKAGNLTIEELLTVFAESFVEPLVEESSGKRFMQLIGWEMLRPRFPKQRLFNEMIKPVMEIMTKLIKELYPALPVEKIVLSITSIVAQLMHTIHITHSLAEIQDTLFASFTLPRRVAHIVEFSSEAIKSMACKGDNLEK